MKLSKSILAVLLATIVAAGFVSSTQAIPISGNINFTGQAVFSPNNLAGATQISSFSSVAVGSADGSFAGVTGPVTMIFPWVFAPVPGSPVAPLWSVGGFMFDLAGTTAVQRPIIGGKQFLVITGTGTVFGPAGFDATPGDWTFSTQNPKANGSFTFSAGTSTTAVPDSGMTVSLLGLGLIGVAALRAKFGKA